MNVCVKMQLAAQMSERERERDMKVCVRKRITNARLSLFSFTHTFLSSVERDK